MPAPLLHHVQGHNPVQGQSFASNDLRGPAFKTAFLAAAISFLFSWNAVAQVPAARCVLAPDEQAVHRLLLKHFQIFEGTVKVMPYNGEARPDRYGPDIAPAVIDFNTRNRGACPVADGALADLSLIVSSHRTRLSRVGFDTAATTAFAEITMIGDPEIGASHFVVLKKDGERWTVTEDRRYRIF